MRNLKFENLDQIRALQQENNRLKVRKITEDMAASKPAEEGFGYETFGPSSGMAKSLLVRYHSESSTKPEQADQHIKALHGKLAVLEGAERRQEEVLGMLALVMAENESLRGRVEEA